MTETQQWVLRAEKLTKHFGELRAVDNVSYGLRPGEVAGIIGPNGAGKTTFFNLITGALYPDAGTVWYRGRDITRLPPDERVMLGIRRTFQLTSTFDELTVVDNLRLAHFRARRKSSSLGAMLAARMEAAEMLRLKLPRHHQGHGEGIAERRGDDGARGGDEVVRIAFFLDACIERHVAEARQFRVQPAEDADARDARFLKAAGQAEEFARRAAARDQDGHVAGLDQAEVAVLGLGRVEKHGRDAGGTERGGELAGGGAALAHARGDDLAGTVGQQPDGAFKLRAQTRGSPLDGAGLASQQAKSGVDHSSLEVSAAPAVSGGTFTA